MIVMVCVDKSLGVAFNHRRQSRDRVLRERMTELSRESLLWVSPYTAALFRRDIPQLRVHEDPLRAAGPGEFCFVERESLADCRPERLYLYRWNRAYPADQFLELPLEDWTLLERREFSTPTHPCITEEVYLPCGT